MVTTNDDALAARIRRLINHGQAEKYLHTELGYNYRMTDIGGAIGRVQLRRLPGFNERRQENGAYLSAHLDAPGIVPPAVGDGRTHVYHQYVVTVTDDCPLSRDGLAAHLRDHGSRERGPLPDPGPRAAALPGHGAARRLPGRGRPRPPGPLAPGPPGDRAGRARGDRRRREPGAAVRVGVIGAGVMGQNHLRVCSELKQVTEVLVHDVRQQAAEAAAARVGATVAGSLEALLEAADAVSICVPTPYHLETAERVAEAGVPMLIEKPICATVEEGERLLEALPRGLAVGVGHIERFNPIVEEIRKIVKEPLYVEVETAQPGLDPDHRAPRSSRT